MAATPDIRTYDRGDAIIFRKTKEKWGGLSNMADGYPLLVNGLAIRTSEALYQACRFPHFPQVQQLIIEQRSPMSAKMKSKPFRTTSCRADWDRVRIQVMRWCLGVKLAQNWDKFSSLLLLTGSKPIVEESHRDAFWGAVTIDDRTLRGANVLGRLLMELREKCRELDAEEMRVVQPPTIPDFLLMGEPIAPIAPVATPADREEGVPRTLPLDLEG